MKREFMKALVLSLAVVSLVFASAVATAYAQTHRLVANVPFAFEVGGKTLPAGKYAATRINNDAGIQLVATQGKASALRLSIPTQSRTREPQMKMVFHRYGDRYFLSQVWFGDNSNGSQLQECKAERACRRERLARAKTPTQNSISLNAAEPEIVTVTANVE